MQQKDLKIIEKLIDDKIEMKLKDISTLKNKDIKILLYNYNKYKNRIQILKDKIEQNDFNILNKGQLIERVQGGAIFKNPFDIIEENKEKTLKELNRLQYIVSIIKKGLDIIKDDVYYDIIKLRYFEKKSVVEILNILHISESNYHKHHSYLIGELRSIIGL